MFTEQGGDTSKRSQNPQRIWEKQNVLAHASCYQECNAGFQYSQLSTEELCCLISPLHTVIA